MAREIGLADAAARTIADRAPRLLVIAGATGTGKSTASVQPVSYTHLRAHET